MPLTDKQRIALEDKARSMKIDPAKLIAEAESLASGDSQKATTSSAVADKSVTKPNLYMYLLPFVTVNEVRTIWLELDPMDGGEENAAAWAAKQGGTVKPPDSGQ